MKFHLYATITQKIQIILYEISYRITRNPSKWKYISEKTTPGHGPLCRRPHRRPRPTQEGRTRPPTPARPKKRPHLYGPPTDRPDL